MATTTATLNKGRTNNRWLIIGLVVIAIAIIAGVGFSRVRTTKAAAITTVPVTRSTIIATITGSGSIAAEQELSVPFQTSGNVTEILVEEGATVHAGQPLAQLDTRDLTLQVANAEASLASAQARLQQAKEGNSKPEELAASQAGLANAQAQLQRTRTGNATPADIASAEAQLRSAQAKLNDLLDGPSADKSSSARARVEQAQATLDAQRNSLATSKSRAESQLTQSANTLRDRQDAYSTIYWQNREREKTLAKFGQELSQTEKDNEAQALRAVQSAEESLRQAQLAYDQAIATEQTGVATAESQLRDAQEQLKTLEAGATQNDIIQAQASVDQAKANLQKLHQGGTAADIAASQATVNQAKANLDRLTAPATKTDLEIQQASVTQAENALAQAKLRLDQATLKAPFNGVVSKIILVPGSSVTGATPAMTIINRNPLHIDLRLSENDVARASIGQSVTLTIDAITGWKATGSVSYIAPAADISNNVVTYRVQVSFPDSEERVKVGMSANVEILTATRKDVLTVPNNTLQPKGAGRVVLIPNTDGTTREVEVQIGLSDGIQTEILSGIDEGQAIVANPGALRPKSAGGMFGN